MSKQLSLPEQWAIIQRHLKIAADGDPGPQTVAAVADALDVSLEPPKPARPPRASLKEPKWLPIARKYLGLREIKGPKHNPKIVQWFIDIKASWFDDDETPWCSAAVGGVFDEAGVAPCYSARAKDWLKWGESTKPYLGCVVVFHRGDPNSKKGHVAILVGFDRAGNPVVWGGNQGDEVNYKVFPKSRVAGYRWPKNSNQPRIPAPTLKQIFPTSLRES